MVFLLDLDQPLPLPEAEAALLVGGKGAGINVMTATLGLPVPPAFALTTEVCRDVLARPGKRLPHDLDDELRQHLDRLGERVGRRFGDPSRPLLVSVRSGAPVSMPGMMDTVLNLGLNEETAAGLAAETGDPAFAQACLDRFRSLFRSVVGVTEVPDDPWAQLRAAIEAVLRSWESDRARAYRAVEAISEDLGTAVVVQAMVFGNTGPRSGTGVLFTRDPATGAADLTGDVLFDAQGEDVVAGTHQTLPIDALDTRMPSVADELRRHARTLEHHYRDMCDIEFTIDRERLWLLQTRVGKRSPHAAVRIAVDMARDPDFPLDEREAVQRVATVLADPPTTTTYDASAARRVAQGVPASPGLATGAVAVDTASVERLAADGQAVLLVRPDTSPQDVPAMGRSAGVLTSRGGPASHAAVVARGWGIPAVVGASQVTVQPDGIAVDGQHYPVGEVLTIDGSTGDVYAGEVTVRHSPVPDVDTLLGWAGELGIAVPQATDARPHDGSPHDGSPHDGAPHDGAPHDGAPHDGAPHDGAPHDPTTTDGASPDTGRTGDAPSVTAGQVERSGADPDLLAAVLVSLSVTGVATVDQLARTLGADVDAVRSAADRWSESGLVQHAAGPVSASTMLRLTDVGSARAGEQLEADRQRLGSDRAERALLDFVPYDGRMKAAVTDWQLRDDGSGAVANDHTDRAYDAAVLSRLCDLHTEVHEWLAPLGQPVPQLRRYLDRLDRAAEHVRDGDHRFVASPRVDSYHSVWFELHELLIRLSGRTREDEAAAGRA